jgi:tetratricopeptide (TPR) repeat protein
MTTLSLSRPRRPRPLAILAASVVLMAASQAATLLAPAPGAPTAPGGGVDVPGAVANPPVTIPGPISAPDAPVGNQSGDLAQLDHSIAAWTANLAANEKDFLSAANLGLLYEARARLSGDVSDFTRAEEAANRSLAHEPRQLAVQALHARILLATHEFSRALEEASLLDRTAPDQPAILSVMADAQLELGRLDAAESLYGRIQDLAPGAALTARQARVAFLRGDPAGAVAGAEAARAAAVADGTTGPSLSWYGYLAGTLNLAAGNPEQAATWFDTALADWPESYLALAGRARAAAALGDTDAAIAGYRAAIAVAPQPDALTALGDLLLLRGAIAGANEQYATVEAVARLQGSGGGLVYNRQLVLFDVNHGRDATGALALAERELAERKDAYGYDAYAWALLANGRAAEADAAMQQALAFGTKDALLLYHAGEIRRSLGDAAGARDLLTQALGIRGALDPLAASKATAALESLK